VVITLDVSDRPQAAVVPRKGLRQNKNRGWLPLINQEDKQELDKSPPSIALPIYTTELARRSHVSMRVSMI